MRRFEDRVAIVAGGGAGVGLAAAARMGREGARIVLVEADRERGERAADLLDANGIEGRLLIGDPSTPSAAKWAATTARLVWGRLDIVVYAARYPHADGAAHTVAPSALDAAYAVDVRGPLLYCQAAIPSMNDRGYGRIVMASSMQADGRDSAGSRPRGQSGGAHRTYQGRRHVRRAYWNPRERRHVFRACEARSRSPCARNAPRESSGAGRSDRGGLLACVPRVLVHDRRRIRGRRRKRGERLTPHSG